jgi:RNA polymerase sigma-70 factor (ECF subfamily)
MTAPTEHSTDDAAVIRQSWHEPEAFAALYDRHATALHRFVTRRLGAAAADDVVAECFLAAFLHRDRYNLDRADAKPWLYGIAANIIGKHRRSEVRLLRALARTGADPVTVTHDDQVENRVVATAAHRALAAALASLSPRDREVLLLIAWADLSYDEIAQALSIPVGTVRSRLNRARRKTREALGDHDPTRRHEEFCT